MSVGDTKQHKTASVIDITANDCHATQNINYDSYATQINFNDCHATLNINEVIKKTLALLYKYYLPIT